MRNHISIDLETLGTKPDSVIVSVGLAAFNQTDGVTHTLYTVLDRDEQIEAGRKVYPDTAIWWMGQSEEAKAVFKEPTQKAEYATAAITRFFQDVNPHGVWGNGADFDCVLLASYFATFGERVPWLFFKNRCLRTLKNFQLGGTYTPPEREGTYHNALDDAVYQAKSAVLLSKFHGLEI